MEYRIILFMIKLWLNEINNIFIISVQFRNTFEIIIRPHLGVVFSELTQSL